MHASRGVVGRGDGGAGKHGRWWEMVGDGGRWWEMVGDPREIRGRSAGDATRLRRCEEDDKAEAEDAHKDEYKDSGHPMLARLTHPRQGHVEVGGGEGSEGRVAREDLLLGDRGVEVAVGVEGVAGDVPMGEVGWYELGMIVTRGSVRGGVEWGVVCHVSPQEVRMMRWCMYIDLHGSAGREARCARGVWGGRCAQYEEARRCDNNLHPRVIDARLADACSRL